MSVRNRTFTRPVPILVALLAMASNAMPQETTVEEFENDSNRGGWSWGTGNESFSPLNGNPGAFLQDLTLFSAHPIVLPKSPGPPSPFIGDYRGRGVTSIGIDLVTLDKQLAVEPNRWLTLVLLDNSGTPNDPNDDLGFYFVGDELVPDAGVPALTAAGWKSFDFEIDSQADTMPPGWQAFTFGPTVPTWPELMADVDSAEFWYGEPGTIFLFDSWDVGIDNVRVTTGRCQEDLGFAGPGNAVLAVCGDVLVSGGTAELTLTGAPASSPAFLVVGLTAAPTPFHGGSLVPVPILFLKPFPTDATGSLSLPVPGGGGPVDLVMQFVTPDASQPLGFSLSNALLVEILP